MSILDAILRGFGAKVGADLAQRGLEQIDAAEREEAERKRAAKRKKWLAIGLVGVSVLGLLFLSGLLADLARWLFGALFLAGLAGGTYYLARGRIRALKASFAEKKTERVAADTEADAKRRIEAQLAELKRKQGRS